MQAEPSVAKEFDTNRGTLLRTEGVVPGSQAGQGRV